MINYKDELIKGVVENLTFLKPGDSIRFFKKKSMVRTLICSSPYVIDNKDDYPAFYLTMPCSVKNYKFRKFSQVIMTADNMHNLICKFPNFNKVGINSGGIYKIADVLKKRYMTISSEFRWCNNSQKIMLSF